MLYQRGQIWHYEFSHKGVRYRGTTGQISKTKAREVERRERDRVALGIEPDAATPLRAVAQSWWNYRGQYLKSHVTVAHRLQILSRHIDFDADVYTVSTQAVAEAISSRRGETTHNKRIPTASTVNRDIIDTLRPVLTHARKIMGLRVQDIDWSELRLKEPRERVREFTAAEIERALSFLPRHYHELVGFYMRYGVRLKEAFFPLSAFDRDEGRVFLRERKGDNPHTIPLLDADRRVLASHASRAERAGLDVVWFREERGMLVALKPSSFQSAMRKAFRKAGITDARPAHDFRHHAGTQFTRATGNLKATQRLLGHENIATTARYAHASEDDILKGLELQTNDTKSHTNTKKRVKK